jgi:hypothetical protein
MSRCRRTVGWTCRRDVSGWPPRVPGARPGLPCPVTACGGLGRLAEARSGPHSERSLGGVGPPPTPRGLRGKKGVV